MTHDIQQSIRDAGLGSGTGKVTINEGDGYAETEVKGERFRQTEDGTLYLVLRKPEYRRGASVRPAYDATYAIAGPGVAPPAGRRALTHRPLTVKQQIAQARAYHAQVED